jgi:hypothetical protein
MPSYYRRIRDGLSATTPMVVDATEVEITPGTAIGLGRSFDGKSTLDQRFEGHYQTVSDTPAHLVVPTAQATATALARIYSKIRAEQSHLNGLTVVGELRKTIDSLRHPFVALVDLVNNHTKRLEYFQRRLKGTERYRKGRMRKMIASTYLEFVFGLAPVISDTRAIAEALARYSDERNGTNLSRSKASGTGEAILAQSTFVPDDLPGVSGWRISFANTTRKTTEYGVQYLCGLRASQTIDSSSNQRLLELLGFTPENFIPALWEVLPWSWLADYFANVGQIIEAGFTSTANVTWISKSVRQRTVLEFMSTVNAEATRLRMSTNGYNGSASGSGGSYVMRRTSLTRTVPLSLGIPPLTFSLPGNAKKLMNMAAVALSRQKHSFQ